MDETCDVLVVGGGAAGLSAALTLSRARRSVLVVDAGAPRNAPAGHVHNYLGREGSPPADLLADGRAEATAYGARVRTGEVVAARALGPDDGFAAELADGTTVLARRLLVTSGLVDELPQVDGVAERWGRDVLHCPYCHGWEVRDAALGVLGSSPMSVHQALLFRQWSADVTLFTHTAPALTDEQCEQLEARGIDVVTGEVAAVEVTGDRLSGVRLRSGRVVARSAVVVAPVFRARVRVLTSLGLEPAAREVDGHLVATSVAADPTGMTTVPGVYVAGNVADPTAQVITAAAAGLTVAAAVNADLVAADVRRAVTDLRARRGTPEPAAG